MAYQEPRNQEEMGYRRMDDGRAEVPQKAGYPLQADYQRLDHEANVKPFVAESNEYGSDVSDDDEFFGINTNYERKGFIKKVYGILSVQLIMTALISLITISSGGFSKFLVHSLWFFILCFIGAFVIEIILVCSPGCARKVPNNYILLFTFTFFESMIVATFCAMANDPFIVFVAALMTCGLVVALTIYAFTTKNDFTAWGSILWTFFAALFIMGLIMIIFQSRFLHILYATAATLLFSFVLIIDTQLLKGQGEFSLSEDDYVVGALMIYVDIITIFIQILSLLMEASRD